MSVILPIDRLLVRLMIYWIIILQTFLSVLFITGIITAEGESVCEAYFIFYNSHSLSVVLAMRTWAVWAQDKFVGYFLIVWVLLTTIPNFTLLGLLAKGLSCEPISIRIV